MAGLADMMSERYGSKKKDDEDKSSDEEGARLGAKFASMVKGGDGESIYNAFAAMKAHCDMKEMGK